MTPTTPASESKPHVTPAQGKPAMSDVEPPPDVQASFGDDAAGAVGSAAPGPSQSSSEQLDGDDDSVRTGE